MDTNVLHLSRAGFNSDRAQALVYLEQTGYREAVGIYYLLKREGATWVVLGSMIDFIT